MILRNGSLEGGGGGGNTFTNEVGQFGLMRFSFVKMLFFAYRILLTRR